MRGGSSGRGWSAALQVLAAGVALILAMASGCGGTQTCGDTQSDPNNCGACGTACSNTQECVMGACVLACTGGTTACGTSCADLMVDHANCGACGMACPAGEVCTGGKCATGCPGGTTMCGASCVDTNVDPANCGGCGTSCGAGKLCSAGKCVSTCSAAQTACTTDAGAIYCANTKQDNTNCGGCGNACAVGQVCAAGKCASSCGPGQTFCADDGGGNGAYCANTQTDDANCGGCGNTCSAGQACVGGSCVVQCGGVDGGGEMLCSPDGGVPYCANTQTDQANCGGCGVVCPSGQVCGGGTCSCAPGLTSCPGDGGPQCVNLDRDNANCGACNQPCTGNTVCVNATCITCNRTVLVLGDGVAASESNYQSMLQSAGFVVTLVSNGTVNWAGSPSASQFGAVIVTPGASYSFDMPQAGQSNLVSAVNAGVTGLVETEWVAYELTTGHYQTYAPLVIFSRTSGFTGPLTFTLTQAGHPVWTGLPNSFTTSLSLGTNVSGSLQNGGTEIASCAQCGSIGVAVRDNGNGRIVQIAHAAAYMNEAWYSDANLKLMMTNAALWAARCY